MKRMLMMFMALCLAAGLCACEENAAPAETSAGAETAVTLTEREKDALLMVYSRDEEKISAGELSKREKELTESIRALEAYMDTSYAAGEWEITFISPAAPASPTGQNYDSYLVSIAEENNSHWIDVEEADGVWTVISDNAAGEG